MESVWISESNPSPLREVKRVLVTRSADYPAETQPWGTHASGIAVLGDGSVLVNWYGGTCRGEDEHGACKGDPVGNSKIYFARLEPGADAFSPTEVFVGDGSTRYMDANYFVDGSALWAVYVRDGGKADSVVFQEAADEQGRTWGPERSVGVVQARQMNPPLRMGGRILAPLNAFDKEGPWRDVVIAGSEDEGASWREHVRMTGADPLVVLREPCLVPIDENEVQMYARVRAYADEWTTAPMDDPRWLAQRSVSKDQGLTWSAPHTINVPNYDSKASVVRLPDGRLLMAFNPTIRRFPLCLAVSSDRGETWAPAGVLDAGPGEMSYPTLFVDHAGDVHVSYTWMRREIMYKRFEII